MSICYMPLKYLLRKDQNRCECFFLKGSCEAPEVENGEVSGKGDANSWTGTFSCKNGFTLVLFIKKENVENFFHSQQTFLRLGIED